MHTFSSSSFSRSQFLQGPSLPLSARSRQRKQSAAVTVVVTLFVGERSVPDGKEYGWIVAAWGADGYGFGVADAVLGMEERFSSTAGLSQAPSYYKAGKKNVYEDMYHFWSNHSGGAQFGMVDGSVQFLSYNVDKTVVYGLASRSGGEVTQAF